MVHDIRATLDVHLNWVLLQMDVADTFISISCKAIFMWYKADYFYFSFLSIIFMPSNCPFFLVIITMGKTCLLSFHLWAHIRLNRSLNLFLLSFIFWFYNPLFFLFLCVFLALLVDDIHILDLASLVPFDFDHSTSQLALMGLVVQPLKCSAWSPFGSPPNFSPFHGFCCFPITLGF